MQRMLRHECRSGRGRHGPAATCSPRIGPILSEPQRRSLVGSASPHCQGDQQMIKTLAFAAALAVLPTTVFAQSSGPVIPDPAGGTTRDPAPGIGTVEVP